MFRYSYIALNGIESACNIYIMHAGKVKYIGFEDIGKGVTVTNSSEQLATSIIRQYDWEPTNCLFFEWYLFQNTNADVANLNVDEIEYEWDEDKTGRNPKWKKYCSLEDNPFKIN